MNKNLNKYENAVLSELQNTVYQNIPLIDLIIKSYTERSLSNEQISNILYQLSAENKISISDNAVNCREFDKLILAHYEYLHSKK